METHLKETLESQPPPSESADFQQTLGGSSSKLPHPTQTLDDLDRSSTVPVEINLEKMSTFDNLSVSCDETMDYCSDSAHLHDFESQEDEVERDDPQHTSPISKLSADSSSHSAEAFSSCGDGDTEIKISMVGAGLANLGNTCFLNAVLQCFIHTVPLVQGLRSCNHISPCERNEVGFCVLCALRNYVEVSLVSTGRVVSPLKLVDNLSYFSSSFRRFQQEDAHEFLQCFLDRLDSCFDVSKTKDMTLPSHDENFVKQGFGGRLVSKLRCCNCGHCSNTYEPSIDLSLEIEDVGTVPTALESFTKVEKIEDPETKFTCENCKEEVSVEKQLMLEQVPSVSVFHLKRFKNDGSYVEKIDKYVEFPLELNLLPYTSGTQNNNVELKYDLYSVVVHTGFSSTSGHYYCFIRFAPNTWYKFDDSKVTRVREDFVLSQEAYILFYAKQGTPWFSSFMKTQKPSIDPNISNTSPKSVLDTVDHICTSFPSIANNPNCEVNETSDAADGISTDFSKRSRPDGVEGSEASDDPQRMCTPLPPRTTNTSGETSCKVERKFSPSALEEKNFSLEFTEVKTKANITHDIPPRSPSPDIYKEESPEVGFTIVRNHLRLVDKVYSKRQPNIKNEDSQIIQAFRTLKTMPGSRSSQLLAAMKGTHSEGSLNKKRSRRMEPAPNRNDTPSNSRHKTNLSSVMRPLAA